MTHTAAGAPGQHARARVERAALELFTSRGFDAVTADEIADAAGHRPVWQPCRSA